MSHAGPRETLIDVRMAFRANLGADVSVVGPTGLSDDENAVGLAGTLTEEEHRACEQECCLWQFENGDP